MVWIWGVENLLLSPILLQMTRRDFEFSLFRSSEILRNSSIFGIFSENYRFSENLKFGIFGFSKIIFREHIKSRYGVDLGG